MMQPYSRKEQEEINSLIEELASGELTEQQEIDAKNKLHRYWDSGFPLVMIPCRDSDVESYLEEDTPKITFTPDEHTLKAMERLKEPHFSESVAEQSKILFGDKKHKHPRPIDEFMLGWFCGILSVFILFFLAGCSSNNSNGGHTHEEIRVRNNSGIEGWYIDRNIQ